MTDDPNQAQQDDPTELMASWPKYVMEATIAADEAGTVYYRQGEIQFPADRESLKKTLDAFMALNDLAVEKIVVACGFGLSDLIDPGETRTLAAGCVQNTWYLETQKKLPAGVVKRHTERVRRYRHLVDQATKNPEKFKEENVKKKKAVKKGSKVPKAPKVQNVYVGYKKFAELSGRGNPPVVYAALLALGGSATMDELASSLEKNKDFKVPKTSTARAYISWYLNHFIKVGIVHVKGEELRPLKAKAKAPKKEKKAAAKPAAKKKAKKPEPAAEPSE